MGVERAGMRLMDELSVEVGVKQLVRSRLEWARHMDRMGDEKLVKRAEAQKVEGKMRRGRQRMRRGTALAEI